MTVTDLLALLSWLAPAVPALMEAMKKGQPVESIIAADKLALDVAFKSARARRAAQLPKP